MLLTQAIPGAGAAEAQSPRSNAAAAIEVPGYTAYSEPRPEAVNISFENGVTGWTDKRDQIVWYGQIPKGDINIAVMVRLAAGERARYALTVNGRRTEAAATGIDTITELNFGEFSFSEAGKARIALQGLERSGADFGSPQVLVLSGPSAATAHFSRAKTRGAPSVHLFYPLPPGAKAAWFYDEVTPRAGPLWTYYCAIGFSRGYFGIQVNSPTERRIIFSVWDSGKEAVDRNKVAASDRVQLLSKGDDVMAGSFGNEGTGGHSHMIYPWKLNQTYRFLVSAEPKGDATIYTGWFYFPEKRLWGLIARFRAPRDGGFLRGFYSFDEDFSGANGQQRRSAEFGSQWIKTDDGRWLPLVRARFSHTADGKAERVDRGGGARGDHFYLETGGFTSESVLYGTVFTRQQTGGPPAITLPTITLPETAPAAGDQN